jgi:2-iminobutanoate/2-iminopropanoate deaminase
VIEFKNPDVGPKPIGPYTKIVIASGFAFLSGQGPIDPQTGEIVSQDIREQTRQTLQNIKDILESQDLSLQDVVKATVFLKDISDYEKVNEVYRSFFGERFPARSCVEVSNMVGGISIEIEVIAAVKQGGNRPALRMQMR